MDAAEKFASEIAATFGTKPRRQGREWRVFCPVHEADGGMHKPSLAIWPTGEARYAYKCMTGCGKPSIRDALRDRGVKCGTGDTVTVEQAAAAKVKREEHRVEQLRKVEAMITEAREIEAGDPVASYLAARGLFPLPDSRLGTLMKVADPIFGHDAFAAALCDCRTITESAIRIVGMSTLSLHENGDPVIAAVTGKKLRSIVGTQRGYGVPYGFPGAHVVIAEGVESMLAALKITGEAFGIATLASSNMPFIALPSFIRKVTIAADNDTPGLEAAASLKNELGHFGVPVTILKWGPEKSGFDANDQLLSMRMQELT